MLKSYYFKTNNGKFYVEDVKKIVEIDTLGEDYIKCIHERGFVIFAIPSRELQYYFECNNIRYNLLPIDLRRGCVLL